MEKFQKAPKNARIDGYHWVSRTYEGTYWGFYLHFQNNFSAKQNRKVTLISVYC